MSKVIIMRSNIDSTFEKSGVYKLHKSHSSLDLGLNCAVYMRQFSEAMLN